MNFGPCAGFLVFGEVQLIVGAPLLLEERSALMPHVEVSSVFNDQSSAGVNVGSQALSFPIRSGERGRGWNPADFQHIICGAMR